MTERARGKTLKIPSIRTIMRAWEMFKAWMKPTVDIDYNRLITRGFVGSAYLASRRSGPALLSVPSSEA